MTQTFLSSSLLRIVRENVAHLILQYFFISIYCRSAKILVYSYRRIKIRENWAFLIRLIYVTVRSTSTHWKLLTHGNMVYICVINIIGVDIHWKNSSLIIINIYTWLSINRINSENIKKVENLSFLHIKVLSTSIHINKLRLQSSPRSDKYYRH